ncbi:MAG: Glyceraldehyde-3-phosphate dehydrogenase/erythrose-4-phosphate dehydrogenase [Candidatus Alkanophagales archaeon MCA70_species_1]|nr:Glyceraldehyde-3-phosphate dehydrogenase/erythrose-4-phosphate dehydrogenase [Candidatus Alkanophaga volatiphilum]
MRVAINGFGRIGRVVLRAAIKKGVLGSGFEIVAVNDLAEAKTLAHLLKYDSVHGILNEDVRAGAAELIVGEHRIKVLSEADPEKLPWRELGVDVVVEATGRFTAREGAAKHLKAGCKKVVITAPAKNPDVTIAPGINDAMYDHERHQIISLASCTTNCLAPLAKVLHERFGIRKGFMTTVHAYTNDQRILDLQHRDLRRARAAALSIIPTTTGAAVAIGEVIPELKGKLDGIAVRVPVANVSIVDFVAELEREVNADEVNKAFEDAANNELKGILAVCHEPLVSIDFIGDEHSSIVDALSTNAIGNLVKVLAWYDNEFGYSCRVVDFVTRLAKLGL